MLIQSCFVKAWNFVELFILWGDSIVHMHRLECTASLKGSHILQYAKTNSFLNWNDKSTKIHNHQICMTGLFMWSCLHGHPTYPWSFPSYYFYKYNLHYIHMRKRNGHLVKALPLWVETIGMWGEHTRHQPACQKEVESGEIKFPVLPCNLIIFT